MKTLIAVAVLAIALMVVVTSCNDRTMKTLAIVAGLAIALVIWIWA
jgi:xanthine/uracil permease